MKCVRSYDVKEPPQQQRQEEVGDEDRDRGIDDRFRRGVAHAFRAVPARHALVTADGRDDRAEDD